MIKINKAKLDKALINLEMKANYISMEYYYPKYLKLLNLSGKVA